MIRIPACLHLVLCLLLVATGCDGDGETPASPAGGGASAAASAGGPTEDAIKAFVTRKEQNLATGVGSAPQAISVEFVSVELGQSRAPNEQDKIDGVRGDTVYPVRVKYKSLRRWGNGETEEKLIHYAYDFYRDPFGGWDAIGLGPVR